MENKMSSFLISDLELRRRLPCAVPQLERWAAARKEPNGEGDLELILGPPHLLEYFGTLPNSAPFCIRNVL